MPAIADRPQPLTAEPEPRSEPLRVVLAEDHALYRRGVARAIERHPDLILAGEADNGDDALVLIAGLQPDVAVLDHRMPGLTGTQVCALMQLEDRLPTAVLMLSAFEDQDLVWNAIGAGVAGYLGKSAGHDEICEAILAVGTGGVAYSERTAAAVDAGFDRHFGRGAAA